jgi:hypothetical protein
MADEKGTARKSEFSQEAEAGQTGLVREFADYLRYNKKWWLTPIIVVLLMVGALVIFGGSAAAPFIYTLF